MRKQIFTGLLVILILCACNNKTQIQKIVDFPKPIELKGEQVFEEHFQIATIQHFDSLIVLTANMEEYFHVFNKDGKPIASFGREGKGPGEFLETPFLTDIYKQDSKTYGIVYDESLKKAVAIDFTTSISENEIIVQYRPKLPPKLQKTTIFEYFYIKENRYAGMQEDRIYNQINQQRNGFIYNSAENKFTLLPLKNLNMQPYERIPAINLNNRKARISPDRSKLAFAMMFYPMVEIFEIGSKSDQPVQYLVGSNPPEGPFKLSDYKERKLNQYFLGLYATNKNLYLLGSNDTWIQSKNQNHVQEIFVLDWDGNPISKYLVPDEYDLSYITIDEKNERIYGISYSNDEAYRFAF